jgi:hypothetical protein
VTSATPDRVVVVVTPGCHLCEDACKIVDQVCADLGMGWQSVELGTLDEAKQNEWRDLVPVVLIDGAVHEIFRVDPTRLRAALISLGR